MKKNIRHFFLLTAFALGTIHLVNRFITMTSEIKNVLKSDNGNFFDWKNGKVYYTKRGTGSPLLLLHTLDPVSSSYEWCRVQKKLEKKHTVYTLDLLGCGRSEKPYFTYTNYLYVQLITDFIKEIIQEKTDVIVTNHSLSFVLLAQNMDADLMKRIIAINPPEICEFDQTPSKCSSLKKAFLESPIIGTFLYNIKTHEINIKKILCGTYFYKPQLVSSKMLDAYYEAAHIDSSRGKYLMASIEGFYTNNPIGHAVKNLSIPLFILESRNIENAVSIVDSYSDLNSLVESFYLSNCGLIPQLEVPDKFLSVIDMFLRQN